MWSEYFITGHKYKIRHYLFCSFWDETYKLMSRQVKDYTALYPKRQISIITDVRVSNPKQLKKFHYSSVWQLLLYQFSCSLPYYLMNTFHSPEGLIYLFFSLSSFTSTFQTQYWLLTWRYKIFSLWEQNLILFTTNAFLHQNNEYVNKKVCVFGQYDDLTTKRRIEL